MDSRSAGTGNIVHSLTLDSPVPFYNLAPEKNCSLTDETMYAAQLKSNHIMNKHRQNLEYVSINNKKIKWSYRIPTGSHVVRTLVSLNDIFIMTIDDKKNNPVLIKLDNNGKPLWKKIIKTYGKEKRFF